MKYQRKKPLSEHFSRICPIKLDEEVLQYYYHHTVIPINSLRVKVNGKGYNLAETKRLKRERIADLRMIPKGIELKIDEKTGKVRMEIDGVEYSPRH